MLRTGRILLVESEEELRQRIERDLELAGHEVASVPDEAAAVRLLEDGLEPDVIVVESSPGSATSLGQLAPAAFLLHLDRTLAESTEFLSADGAASSSCDSAEVARHVEELLLARTTSSVEGAGERCLEVASRLTSSLRQARHPEERAEILVDVLGAYFGVRGSLMVRRTRGRDDWVLASRGLSHGLTEAAFAEIVRRSSIRALRPFLTRIAIADTAHEILVVPAGLGENELIVAVWLDQVPGKASLRHSFVNLLGSAVRAAHAQEKLAESEALLDAHSASFENLLSFSRDFARAPRRAALGEKIMNALRRELEMPRSALFLLRDGEGGMLDLHASSGFAPVRLDRIGLSRHHGVGVACFTDDRPTKLASLAREGAAAREIGMLLEVGLAWAVPLTDDDEPSGILFFGGAEPVDELAKWDAQALRAIVGSAAVTLRHLEQLERLERLSVGAIRGLVEALEMARPEERGHADRVASYARLLGIALGLEGRALQSLSIAALLHDVGKIAAASADATPARITRLHPILSSQILSRSKPVPEVIQAVEQHHERFDGHGHPYGLRGDGIHLHGRILAIADAFDRARCEAGAAAPPREALLRLQRGAGLLFDPGLVAVFTGAIEQNPEPFAGNPPADWFFEDSVPA
jgi:GAF domain-containing protein